MLIVAKYPEQLKSLALTTLEGQKRFKGDLVSAHQGKSDTSTFSIAESGRTVTLFLKRNWKIPKRSAIESLLWRGRILSSAQLEWENMKALHEAGIRTAGLVAMGDERAGIFEKFSCIITESAGDLPMERFIRECRDPKTRKRVFHALALYVRKMHESGFGAPDLYMRHLFLEPQTRSFTLIDMARLDRRRNVSSTIKARDLASLNASAPMRYVSSRERISFLKTYAGRVDRALIKKIRRRMRRLLKRSKFAQFAVAREKDIQVKTESV